MIVFKNEIKTSSSSNHNQFNAKIILVAVLMVSRTVNFNLDLDFILRFYNSCSLIFRKKLMIEWNLSDRISHRIYLLHDKLQKILYYIYF